MYILFLKNHFHYRLFEKDEHKLLMLCSLELVCD